MAEMARFHVLLYIHIPFCHRICPYCSFYKHTPGATAIGDFIDALLKEATIRIPTLAEKPRTIFFGGGTPSMLSPFHLKKLIHGLQNQLDFSQLDEISLEANPATFDEGKATLFRELGISRISLGIQSFSDHVLTTLGREHSAIEAEQSVKILQAVGMPAVNIDLMFSIPGQSADDWRQTVTRAISLEPNHISAYNLTYEEDTAFFQSLMAGEMQQDEETNHEHFFDADDLLTKAGFEHYETSNYAKPGHQSSHNRGYWMGENYLGLGPSAVSTIDALRTKNIPDTAAYVERIRQIGHATSESESLDHEALRLERLSMGMRTSEGIPLSLLEENGLQRAHVLAGFGLLEMGENHLCLTKRGSALVDSIAGEIA
jgi:oxygen-independent coproporphyrinogen-3 oxidase